MKNRKPATTLLALLLSLILALGMSSTALAAAENTITVNNAKVGETYNIYMLIDIYSKNADNTKFIYKLTPAWETFFTTGAGKDYVTVTKSGTTKLVTWKKDVETNETNRTDLAAKAAAAITDSTPTAHSPITVAASGTETTASITFDGLEPGYYLITSTLGTKAMIATTPQQDDVSINEKNDSVTDTKQVQEDSQVSNPATGGWGSENSAQIGDTVHFRANVNAKRGAKNYVYHDKMDSGLTFLPETVTVQAGTNTLTADTDYTLRQTVSDDCTFEVVFAAGYLNTIKTDTTIVIAYDAVLNDKATVGTSQYNREHLTWGGGSATTETTTETNTYQFSLLKYDAADTAKKALAGATFRLYNASHDDAAVKLVATNSIGTAYRVATPAEIAAHDAYDATTATESAPTAVLDSFTTIAATDSCDGVITISGVDLDTYKLVEITAPPGYNMLAEPISITPTATGTYRAEVANSSGTLLPATGGMGTTLFYLLGVGLVAGAVLLISRRTHA